MASNKGKQNQQPSNAKGDNYQGEQQQQPDGVAVFVTPGENGNSTITVQTLGTTKATEAPTLLELGARRAREQLGL